MTKFRKMLKDTKGATAIEYGLMAAGIGVAIMATVFLIGPELNRLFQLVLTQLQGAG